MNGRQTVRDIVYSKYYRPWNRGQKERCHVGTVERVVDCV